ncbi:MAG: Fe-S cluster assembly protein SufD [Beijerinckiaceae bacterium]
MNAPVTIMKTAAETELSRHFEAASRWLPGEASKRRTAMAAFEAMGLPHRRIEAWHYTDLRALMRKAEAPAIEPRDDATRGVTPFVPTEGLATVTLVNGWLTGTFALPPGIEFFRLADALAIGHPLASRLGAIVDLSKDAAATLNAAFMTDGAIIRVPAGLKVEQPLHLAFEDTMTSAASTAPRVLVIVEAGASFTLVETHRGPAGIAYQTNALVEVDVAEGASFEHVRLNLAGDMAQTISTLASSVAKHASFRTLSLITGAALGRNQVFVRVDGDHAKVNISGVTLLKGTQHADNTLVVEHAALHGVSRELFRTVVDDDARGVFQGKIIVQSHAQKTDGRMASNALLLGENASMHGKPELEIFADDVQCAHGATVGALDGDLLFYLMSRGIDRKAAEGLMIEAFAGEALADVSHEGLREALGDLVRDWLKSRR